MINQGNIFVLTFLQRLLLSRGLPAEGPYKGTRFLSSFPPKYFSIPNLFQIVYFRIFE